MFSLEYSYQFLEDAYKNHKQHMESMTHQLQEKQKLIEEVSNSINNGYVLDYIMSSTQSIQKLYALVVHRTV